MILFIGIIGLLFLIDVLLWIYGVTKMYDEDHLLGIIFLICAFLFLGMIIFLIELILLYWL